MLYELSEKENELINKADKETFMKTDVCFFEEKKYIDVKNLFAIIEDLICELHNEKEKNEDLENDIKNNYKVISKSEQYE